MKLASLAFLMVLVVAHLSGDPGEGLGLPLSMFRDGAYRPFGYVLFALLLVIAGQMLRTLHRAELGGHACLLGVVALFLLLVAVTPSANAFHLLCSFVVLALLFGYYATVVRGVGRVWLWAHLAVPVLLVLLTRCHSYGLWQKSLIVYFLLAVNVQHSLLLRGLGVLRTAGGGRPRPGSPRLRRRVAYRAEPGRSWLRRRLPILQPLAPANAVPGAAMSFRTVVVAALGLACTSPTVGQETVPSRDAVIARLRPYEGPSIRGVSRSTLTGKVVCGYQGWFTAPQDGSGRGWRHYTARGQFKPGACSIDLWPDVSELDAEEKYATPFRHADGSVAYVFSSHNRKTALRHFRWMEQYGIDGVFVQRFAVETLQPLDLRHCNTALSNCREGANRHGRCYAVMYDLSGLPQGGVRHVVEDWKLLVDKMRLGHDPRDAAYLRHQGKPVVAVWGVGFKGRKYTLAECERLVEFLKHDKEYGGCTVLLGVPAGWRTLDADSVKDPALHRIIRKADIISPWTVGRYNSLKGVADHAQRRWQPDLKWCREQKKDYLPVVFPGFSWHNLRPKAPLDQIPRLKGRFLWRQVVEAKQAGATMLYTAMFDEMDEGTAIFKCSNDPPVGGSRFLTFEGLPSDHYLWLTGMGGKLLRGDIKATGEPPPRTRPQGGQEK